jgi:hypothetical protein
MLPKAHFATVYAKPKGRPLVDTFVTEVSQDTWIYFPWDHGLHLPGTDRQGSYRLSRRTRGIRTRAGAEARRETAARPPFCFSPS